MKQIKIILSIALIAMIGLFTSCEDDETTNEIFITERNAPETIAVGDTTELEFSIQSDADLAKIELFKNNDRLDTKEENFKENSSDIYTYTFIPDTTEAGNTLSFALYVTDENDLEERYDFEIAVEEMPSSEINLTSYTDVQVYGALADGTNEDLFSIETGNVYTYNELTTEEKGLIDFVYAYSDMKAFQDQLVSPADLPSDYHNGETLPNTTNMEIVTDVTFSEVDGNAIVNNISGLTNVNVGISEGDVVAFITDQGHKGYLKLKTVAGGTGDASDNIVFDVKAVLASDMP